MLIPIWIDKYERREFDDDAIGEELLPEYETLIAALERLVGRQAREIEFLKWRGRSQRSASTSVITGLLVRQGCALMDLPRSSFYASPGPTAEDPIIGVIRPITETCRNYGYRRVTAELRHRGLIVNSKKVQRIIRQNSLNPKWKRRYVVTTDSSHDSPIYPHVAIETGFVYLAVILDTWSRKVVGYGLGRNIDVRLTVAALQAAIASRRPLPGCVLHTDRGAQYAASQHRCILKRHGFFGSMSRRANPYDNAQAESFIKTLKVEAVYATEYETFDDVAAVLPNLIDNFYNTTRLHSALGYLSPNQFEKRNIAPWSKRAA
ncbi:MAG: IS3 family transposase [Pararhodobacter sp.]|nr:IS3 family transposase [Pararhodobacter sp.]